MKKQFQTFNVECKATKKNTIRAVFSTSDQDRHGDVVVQSWDLNAYKSNPVILNSHSQGDATEVIGKAVDIRVENNQLQGEIEFAVKENPKAKVIHDLYKGGFLRAFSVGFVVKGMNEQGFITDSELLEISAVSVPANQFALAKQKGIDVELLEDESTDNTKEETDEEDVVEEEVEEVVEAVEEEKEEVADDVVEKEEDVSHETEEEEEEEVVEEEAVEDTSKSILKAVQELREEQKGRTLDAQRKKEVNKAIRELLELKKQ